MSVFPPSCDACSLPAVVINPGQDAEHAGTLFAISRAVADRQWCLCHARAAGWPWISSETASLRREWAARVA